MLYFQPVLAFRVQFTGLNDILPQVLICRAPLRSVIALNKNFCIDNTVWRHITVAVIIRYSFTLAQRNNRFVVSDEAFHHKYTLNFVYALRFKLGDAAAKEEAEKDEEM
jgi:hypothetical protein